MKKSFNIAVITILLSFSSQAQVKLGMEIGPWVGISSSAPDGFLANFKTRFGLSDNFYLGVNIGFVLNSGATLVPLCGTIEYYLRTKGFKPFLGADAGYFLNKNGTAFMAPAAGFAYGVNKKVDITARVSLPIMFNAGTSISMPICIGVTYRL